ncbi:MAG: 2-oxo-4-hydroxy-4-carboxy-5-ureidoimidazoline decarboxylase [Verrucomicrobiales bacterium]|nr:2-oxo-4-hydroxy-4-carboxy-5-ureidoimidazoline decarboxylase [Verrucomicrobiales bacterium]
MTVEELNQLEKSAFVERVGPVFENSPWIAAETWHRRPFASRDRLLFELSNTVLKGGRKAQKELIQAHPDLAGKLAAGGKLTEESTREQAAAGITKADKSVIAAIQDKNKRYRKKFGFPFVICARLNNVETILKAFDERLQYPEDVEIDTALKEIFKIARLRLFDIVSA